MTLDFLYTITPEESEFLEKIGLPPHTQASLPHAQRYIIGTTTMIEGASINVWVEAWPAQFWIFEITTIEGDLYHVETGSGRLSDYWPTIEMIANNLLAIR